MAKYVRNAANPAAPAESPSSTTQAQRARPDDTNGRTDYEDFGKRVSGHAQQMVDEEISQRLGRGALELARFADALRSAGARLEGSRTGPYFNSAAGQIEHAAELLRTANAREIVDGVERFARQSPLMFVGGAIALGLGAGRFLKSTAGPGSAVPALPSHTRTSSNTPTARQSARRTNQQASQTRGNEP
jgi:hypothetical protein